MLKAFHLSPLQPLPQPLWTCPKWGAMVIKALAFRVQSCESFETQPLENPGHGPKSSNYFKHVLNIKCDITNEKRPRVFEIVWGARNGVFLDFMLIASCKLSTLVFCTFHLLQRWRGWTLTETDHQHLTLQMVQSRWQASNRPFAKVQKRQRTDLKALDKTGPIPCNDWWNRKCSLINSMYKFSIMLQLPVSHLESTMFLRG